MSGDDNRRVDLAHTDPFALGELWVEPSQRLVAGDDGSQIIEPRVMQLLVALARSEGRILSRNDLIMSCWGGRVVGDNAIHRAISRLRQIAKSLGAGSFDIESVRGVGYRLAFNRRSSAIPSQNDHSLPIASSELPLHRSTSWRRVAPGGLGLLLVAGILGGAWAIDTQASDSRVLSVVIGATEGPAADGPSEQWARQLAIDLRQLRHGDHIVATNGRSHLNFGSKDRTVRVATSAGPMGRSVDVALNWEGSDTLLWSASFPVPAGVDEALRRQIAIRLAAALQCLQRAFDAGLGTTAAALYLRACANVDARSSAERVSILRMLARANPRSAFAWAQLSHAEANLAGYMSANNQRSGEAAALGRLAREHLKKAEALDSGSAATALARAVVSSLDDPTAWEWRLGVYDAAISNHPQVADLYAHRSRELMRVGRVSEAIADSRRSVELEPYSSLYRAQLILILAYHGLATPARRQLAEAERLWPDSVSVMEAKSVFNLRYGDPGEAIAAAEAEGSTSTANAVWKAYLNARQEPDPAKIAKAISLSEEMYQRRPSWALQHLQLLGHFGENDRAYDLLLGKPSVATRVAQEPTILFRAHMDSLRRDRRFLKIAGRSGLYDYWQRTGQWPDFCLAADLPYDCRFSRRV